MEIEDEDGEFPIGLGCALDMFRERDEVMSLLDGLPESSKNERSLEIAYQKFVDVLDRYQEQPHLLDRHLEEMIDKCLTLARQGGTDDAKLKHASLMFLRQVFKVRGPKEVVKKMPHEIADLVPVLEFLEQENLEDGNTWETGYVLVMWMSILVINPFSLKLLDGQLEEGTLTTAERIMRMCNKCMQLNNKTGDAAPFLISRFLTRPDMLDTFMPPFVASAVQNLDRKTDFPMRYGSYAALASIFKHGKRQEVLPYGTLVLEAVLNSGFANDDTLIRKHAMKLLQRIGMMFMKTKIAPWRYQRGSRSLVKNLKADAVQAAPLGKGDASDDADYEELEQFSGEIELLLDKLLEGLKDKDTVVRWSAAKGIGRVTNRLPQDYGDQVVESLLQIFSERESSGAWHGGCLALAELGRRGLLLPERLSSVVPVIQRALVYDEIRGNYSVGSHVRDAACYVLWAFARAFEPSVIEPYVHDIATAMIITMVFDREVNCRRAAAAAFQENVGRQGNFPHGIEIVTIADYFAVGSRGNAFTKLSVDIARFPQYTRPLIDHLVEMKYNHFDTTVRELTAEALGSLAHLDPDHVRSLTISKLLPVCAEPDNHTSHGSILCLSSVLVALKSQEKLDLTRTNVVDIKNIVPSILYRKFRGQHRGNELMRQALSVLIKCCSIAKLPFHEDEKTLTDWQCLLEENLSYIEVSVRLKAADALKYMVAEYYVDSSRPDLPRDFVTNFSKTLSSSVLATRMGYATALGKLPLVAIRSAFQQVVTDLLNCTKITAETSSWAESRRDAISALAEILANPITKSEDWELGIPFKLIDCETLIKCFVDGIKDYTTDKRGDVGCWVREASMRALKVLILGLYKCDPELLHEVLQPQQFASIIGQICKQCIEKIDNVRVHAGKVFTELLHYDNGKIGPIPQHSELIALFPFEFCQTINWRSTSVTFPLFAQMVQLKEYSYDLLSGFIISGGNLSDTTYRDAHNAIGQYLQSFEEGQTAELTRIGNIILQIFTEHFKQERVTVPAMKFLSQLLQSGLFSPVLSPENDGFGISVINAVKAELLKSNRVEKLVGGIELLCELLQGSPNIVCTSLKRLFIYLCHAYPRIRAFTAQQLLEAFLSYGDSMEFENLDQVTQILSSHRWESNVEPLKAARNQICQLLNIPEPVLLKPPQGALLK